jgi:hypothetical protein
MSRMSRLVRVLVAIALLCAAAPASASTARLVKSAPESYDLALVPPTGCAPREPPVVSASGASVRAVLLRDLRKGALTPELYAQYRDEYKNAHATVHRLGGIRRTNLGGVIRSMERMSRGGLFTVSRMPALFFQLKHNVDFWPRTRLPHLPAPTPSPCRYFAQKSGYVTPVRYVFDDSPIVFQYYPGYGLQLQPLANFGKANALANACKGVYGPGEPCHLDQLKQLLDALIATASLRGGSTTWEYWFPFGGGSPPWTSGLSQGTAIQALVAGAQLLGDPHYLDVARSALGIFQLPPPNGVRVDAFGGDWYLQYSFDRHLFILNGFLQSLNGIFDLAKATNDPAAQAIFTRGDRAAQNAIPRYDTGAWSLYALNGNESDLNYHRVVRDFLKGLCQRTNAQTYCKYSQRFTDYLSQRVRVDFMGAAGARARHSAAIRFRLSKISCVGVVVKRGGKVAYANRLQFPRGVHGFGWVPRARGKYQVTLTTIDYLNHRTITTGRVTVRR